MTNFGMRMLDPFRLSLPGQLGQLGLGLYSALDQSSARVAPHQYAGTETKSKSSNKGGKPAAAATTESKSSKNDKTKRGGSSSKSSSSSKGKGKGGGARKTKGKTEAELLSYCMQQTLSLTGCTDGCIIEGRNARNRRVLFRLVPGLSAKLAPSRPLIDEAFAHKAIEERMVKELARHEFFSKKSERDRLGWLHEHAIDGMIDLADYRASDDLDGDSRLLSTTATYKEKSDNKRKAAKAQDSGASCLVCVYGWVFLSDACLQRMRCLRPRRRAKRPRHRRNPKSTWSCCTRAMAKRMTSSRLARRICKSSWHPEPTSRHPRSAP